MQVRLYGSLQKYWLQLRHLYFSNAAYTISAVRMFFKKQLTNLLIGYGHPFLMDNYYSDPSALSKTFTDEVYRYSRQRLAE